MDNELIDESLLPEARRMHQLIEDLLLLARSDEDAMELRHDDVDIDDLLLAEASRLRAIGSVHTVTHIQACRTVGDRAALARVVRNLVDNAVRHASSTVTWTATPRRVTRSSRSPTTDPASRPKTGHASSNDSFASTPPAPGLRGDRASACPSSSRSVRSHDGTVAVGDAAAGGAVFTLTLPLAQQDSAGTDFQGSGSVESR